SLQLHFGGFKLAIIFAELIYALARFRVKSLVPRERVEGLRLYVGHHNFVLACDVDSRARAMQCRKRFLKRQRRAFDYRLVERIHAVSNYHDAAATADLR